MFSRLNTEQRHGYRFYHHRGTELLPSPKAPRIITSTDDNDLSSDQVNQLFAKAGLPVRDPEKLQVALQHSLLCVTAKILREGTLVGFVRVTGDGVFNAAIWDFTVDPTWPNVQDVKQLLIQRLKQEIRRLGLQCSVTIFAAPEDIPFLKQANFNEDRDGIRAMALAHESLLAQSAGQGPQNGTSGIV